MKVQERGGAGTHRGAAPGQPAGERLPAPPRERKPALAALAVLLILIGALGATVLVLRAGDRVEVYQLTRDVPAGHAVSKGDLTTVMVAADNHIDYIRPEQYDALTKLRAKSNLYEGSVLVGQMFAAGGGTEVGKAAVGVSLKEGQYPTNLKDGETVAVYRVGTSAGSGKTSTGGANSGSAGGSSPLVQRAVVSDVGTQDKSFGSGNLAVTLTVNTSEAAAVAQAASAGEVAVVRVAPDNG
ncbi:SAF domain-containing protein [Streptomyces hundungensis]|uniref:SAF domain-containing protein n=1 Tax=Streptomyces hundungensis TaxID=1077946 RepID=UPI0033CD0571